MDWARLPRLSLSMSTIIWLSHPVTIMHIMATITMIMTITARKRSLLQKRTGPVPTSIPILFRLIRRWPLLL